MQQIRTLTLTLTSRIRTLGNMARRAIGVEVLVRRARQRAHAARRVDLVREAASTTTSTTTFTTAAATAATAAAAAAARCAVLGRCAPAPLLCLHQTRGVKHRRGPLLCDLAQPRPR